MPLPQRPDSEIRVIDNEHATAIALRAEDRRVWPIVSTEVYVGRPKAPNQLGSAGARRQLPRDSRLVVTIVEPRASSTRCRSAPPVQASRSTERWKAIRPLTFPISDRGVQTRIGCSQCLPRKSSFGEAQSLGCDKSRISLQASPPQTDSLPPSPSNRATNPFREAAPASQVEQTSAHLRTISARSAGPTNERATR